MYTGYYSIKNYYYVAIVTSVKDLKVKSITEEFLFKIKK